MLEHDASLALRVEIVETALAALFETLPEGHAARAKLVELLERKIKDVGFARARREELERALNHVKRNIEIQEAKRDNRD